MDYKEWMERTNRGVFKPRSKELKAVDAEFKKIGFIKSPAESTALRTAFKKWKEAKGPMWRMNHRNFDGAVEELDKLINQNLHVFNQAALTARLMEQRIAKSEIAIRQRVMQKFGGNDRDFAGVKFEWDVVFGIVKRGTAIEVKVRVAGNMNDETASNLETIPDPERIAFRTHIQSAWNKATVVVEDGPKKRYYDLLFDLEWTDADDPRGKYSININKLHPTTPNRDNLLNWLFGNREACIHEFGHMIGCPDEYNTIEVQGFGHVIQDPAMYNQAGWTTDSIMNNPGKEGRIHQRHFNFVARHIRQLMKSHTEVKLLQRFGPTHTQEMQQLIGASMASRRRAMGFADD